MLNVKNALNGVVRRSPHGERGLKCVLASRLVRLPGRSPHGERGLKFKQAILENLPVSRSPHGERGLKCHHRHATAAHRVALLMESVD